MRTVAFKTFGCRLNQAETVAFEQALPQPDSAACDSASRPRWWWCTPVS